MDIDNIINIYKEIVIFLGIVSNVLNIAIQSRKNLRGTWISVYLRVLAFNYLINNIIFAFDSINSPFPKTLLILNIVCKFSQYFVYAFAASSSWILAYISIDRYITITYLRKPKCFEKILLNVLIFALIFGWNLIYYSPFFIFFQSVTNFDDNVVNSTQVNFTDLNVVQNETDCMVIDPNTETILGLMDLVNSTLLPFLIMLIFTILIIMKIMKSKKKISKHKKIPTKPTSKRQNKDMKFSFIILILNAVFLIFNLPITINALFPFLSSQFSNTFFETYYSIDFFIYLSINSVFRDEFLIMLRIKNKRKIFSSSTVK